MNKVIIASSSDWERGGGVATHIKMLESSGSENKVDVIISLNKLKGFQRFIWLIIVASPWFLIKFFSRALALISRQVLADFFISLRLFFLTIYHKPQCVNFHGGGNVFYWWITSKMKKRPNIVLTVHGYMTYEAAMNGLLPEGDKKWRKRLLFWESIMYRNADEVICVDNRIARHIKRLGRKNVKILKNAVPLFELNRKPCDGLILCPRMLTEKNGVRYAVMAMEYLNNMKLIVAGDGPDRHFIEQLIQDKRLTNVELKGFIPFNELKKLYQIAEMVVVPSCSVSFVQEATSIAVLEALSFCVPVIASDIGGIREIITNNINGILVPQKSPEKLAEAMKFLHNNPVPRDLLSKAGRQLIEEQFNVVNWIKEYINIWF